MRANVGGQEIGVGLLAVHRHAADDHDGFIQIAAGRLQLLAPGGKVTRAGRVIRAGACGLAGLLLQGGEEAGRGAVALVEAAVTERGRRSSSRRFCSRASASRRVRPCSRATIASGSRPSSARA